MRDPLSLLVLLLLILGVSSCSAAPRTPQDWLRHLLPLPKEIAIERTISLPVEAIAVTVVDGGEVEANAARLLREALGSGIEASAPAPTFRIRLGRCSPLGRFWGQSLPGADRLRRLPNSDQAYAIAPLGDNALALTGLTDRAVFHAAMTVRQLLAAGKQGDQVTIPLVRVVDWPDLAERGEWGGSANRDIETMATEKMNLVETHIDLTVDDAGRGVAHLDEATAERGRLHALKVVPIITHLDQLQGTGVYERYPELKGKGDKAGHAGLGSQAPCFSQPKLWDILADWMVCLSEQPGVSDICAWLSEEHVSCGCADCKQVGQYALEARALVKAWRLAHERNPKVKLRILLTQGSYDTNDKVLAEVPPEVYVTYYDGGRTYDSSRDPMIYPLLEDYAKQGRWLGCYPQLTASWRIVCPWPGPQFIKYRLTEFVDKGLQCLCGYATPDNRLYDFNVAAAAEWSWNAHGRDEREFAAAWATRRGYRDPDRVADWAVMLGPVGWDVYGSRVPYSAFFGEAAAMIRGRNAPSLGAGMYRYFPTVQHLDDDLAICDRAMKLAQAEDAPLLIAETQVIQGYVMMLRKLYDLGALLAKAPPGDVERAQLNRDLFDMTRAGLAVSQGLRDWSRLCGDAGGSRLGDTIQVTEQTLVDVSRALEPLGLRNPQLTGLRQKAGAWADEDFTERQAITKTWEVTSLVRLAGTYQVLLQYTQGWWGLNIKRVALASAAADAPANLTEVAVDQHGAVTGAESKDNVYTLKLDQYDPARRYFLVADVSGVSSEDKPENRRGCQGEVFAWRERPAGEEMTLPPLESMDPAEQARYGAPRFTTTDLHVAVVMGGYGSEGLLGFLRDQPGLEAQPLWNITPEALPGVQVVILTQPRLPGSLRPEAVALLTSFAQDGGGLLATHDAVGFRGLPPPVPQVCAGGADKARGQDWLVTADHPATAGLARNTPLPKTYYDYITLQPGPEGVILATSPDKAPVVIAGPAGKGRYVACGLALGLGAEGDRETTPGAAEGTLLLNVVKWVGGR